MNQAHFAPSSAKGFLSTGRWQLFLGLSRTPHGLLDMATPAMAALLWLGKFPPASVMVVGLITAFAGYTAVYALNDLVDWKVDQERLGAEKEPEQVFPDVDQVMMRHPVAQGALSFREGLLWCLFWSIIALLGALWLNPMCAALFILSASMEAVYCKLLKITHLKFVPSAIVKATGGLVGVLAVDPQPSSGFCAVLFLWLAAWEISCQNIPNDIMDMENDARVGARTTPTVKGIPEAVFRILCGASMATFGSVAIYWLAGQGVAAIYPIMAAFLGWECLLKPARQVYYEPSARNAALLFDRASYMPLMLLLIIVTVILFPFPG